METEVLDEGFLSLRQKGDLFWKKYKLQRQAEELLGSDKKRHVQVAGVLHMYKSASPDEKTQPDGNEFKDYPPTATGRDVMRNAVVRAMLVRDKLRNDPECDGHFLDSLSDAITAFFESAGYDEITGKPIDEKKKAEACSLYPEKVKAYEEAYRALQAEKVKVSKPETAFKKKRIRPPEFDAYAEDIPENYLGQLRSGSVIAECYHMADEDESCVFGVVLHAKHEGFKEIIWISIREEYMEDLEACKDFLRFVIWEAYEKKEYKGVFTEMHVDEHIDKMTEVLRSAGMSVYFEKNNIYECCLSDVHGEGNLFAASDKLSCVSVSQLSPAQRDELEKRIEKCRQPVPLAYPVMWDSYRADLSVAYLGQASDTGLLLISEVGDSLDIELLYGSNPMIVAALSGTALRKAQKHLPPTQKLLVPIVNEHSRPLIKKLMPTAVRGDIAEAVIWF